MYILLKNKVESSYTQTYIVPQGIIPPMGRVYTELVCPFFYTPGTVHATDTAEPPVSSGGIEMLSVWLHRAVVAFCFLVCYKLQYGTLSVGLRWGQSG